MSKQRYPQQNSPQQQGQLIQGKSLMYSAPLPPSSEFDRYEQTLPGAANRIIAMAEKEIEHRHKNENQIVEHSIKNGCRGQILAFILAILSLGMVFFSILKGEPLGAIAPGILAFSSLIAVSVWKKQ